MYFQFPISIFCKRPSWFVPDRSVSHSALSHDEYFTEESHDKSEAQCSSNSSLIRLCVFYCDGLSLDNMPNVVQTVIKLALRLRPHMRSLVSINQSAFIKGRSIHDNFLFVRNMARRFHRTNRPMLLFKLDITKAFDSIRWDYLMALLQRLDFPVKWRYWLGALLYTSTSQVLLNGIPGQKITHGRGLWQGDPLSPLLFVLAIDPTSPYKGNRPRFAL